MSNKFEIHCVKIEKTQSSSSVQGEVRGSGMTINGTGGSSVRGRTDTVHTSQVTANGKMYMLKQKNASYPFSEGDDMVFLCKRNDKTGMYEIISLLNNSNGTLSTISHNRSCVSLGYGGSVADHCFVCNWLYFGSIGIWLCDLLHAKSSSISKRSY